MKFLPRGSLDFTPLVWMFVVTTCMDGAITLYMLSRNMSVEINPILMWAHHASPLLFVGVKLGLAYTVLSLIAHIPNKLVRSRILGFGVLVFSSAVVYQCILLSLFLFP